MKYIQRNQYLEWLTGWKDEQIIKVVSGVRRSGKSTLLEMYRDYLLNNGIIQEQITALNFEDIEYEDLCDYKKLYNYLKERIIENKKNYIFLDEIQHVDQFEKVVDTFFLKENCDVYITGSNAYFMSGDLATLLSGRYVELKILPLSFKEFINGSPDQFKSLNVRQIFDIYIENGSFPYTVRFGNNKRQTQEYLRDIYNTVLVNDIVKRLKITNIDNLERITKFLLHNIGNIVSMKKIANTLTSNGKGIDEKTVNKYVKGLTDSLLFYEVRRYNIKGKQFLTTNNKYYAVDMGLRSTFVKGEDSDIGHILENIVYLELLRRGYDVFVGESTGNEVDFVAVEGNQTTYYQVAASTLDDRTLKRELSPLKQIEDNYPKILLTLDDVFAEVDYNGIKKTNVLNWLLK